MLPSGERLAAVALWCVPGVTRQRLEALRERFGTLAEALSQPAAALAAAGLPEAVAARVAGGEAAAAGERALGQCERMGARVLVAGELGWPEAFDRVPSPPMAVFAVGRPFPWPAAAIVGARRADAYGLERSRRLGGELASRGVAVISGGALGVDGAAHAPNLSHPEAVDPALRDFLQGLPA